MKKKKSTEGQKREKTLRYRFRQLKKMSVISKDMTLKQFRGSEFNAFTTKKVTLTNKRGQEFIRKAYVYVPFKSFKEVTKKDPRVKAPKPGRKDRRREKRSLRHKILIAIQKASKISKERRKNEKNTTKAKVPRTKSAKKISKLPNKFSGRPKVNVDLV